MTALLVTCLLLLGPSDGIPSGTGRIEVELDDVRLDVFTYRPGSARNGPMLVVFHGVLRNAEQYRDDARAMGDRFGMLVVAPRFDKKQFGAGRYQQGGLFRDGEPRPPSEWSWSLVPKLVRRLRSLERRPDMPYYLIGHSAGAQFLGRMCCFVPADATRVVVANPSSYLSPTRDLPYPYGFGNLPEALRGDDQLRRYLAQPLTIYLGSKDTERDEDFDDSPEADRQGRSRFERGHNVFRVARQLAEQKGWDFGWRLVEAPSVGHDHLAMFNAPACESALLGQRGGEERDRQGIQRLP